MLAPTAIKREQSVVTDRSTTGPMSVGEAMNRVLSEEREAQEQLAACRAAAEQMEIGWRLLRLLPEVELSRLSEAQIERHIRKESAVG